MKSKKVFILLPDGVGLRNFAFTSFVHIGESLGYEVIFWNQTEFDLDQLGFKEIRIQAKPRPYTDLLKRAKIKAELDHFTQKFNDPIYQHYKFTSNTKGVKSKIKAGTVNLFVKAHTSEKGLQSLRKQIKNSERKSELYTTSKNILEKEKPDFVFCTNQRPVTAVAPLTAAQDLGIPTASFIFSWDNLPKATMVVETDLYFVWSDYMKHELLDYYPYIKKEQIKVTGSPQFEPHYNPDIRLDRNSFFKENNLDPDKKYICFSGDDITTSPDDPQYLRDLSEAVEELNKQGENLGIIFRRCPTDFSDRYDMVLTEYTGLIKSITPKWKKYGENWNTIFPTMDDLSLQINTILHSEAVVNVGSSMVFDFAIFDKPCLFINYNVPLRSHKKWDIKVIYKFIHFRSMPTNSEVYWINSKLEIGKVVKRSIHNSQSCSKKAFTWFKKINHTPADKASARIWEFISQTCF